MLIKMHSQLINNKTRSLCSSVDKEYFTVYGMVVVVSQKFLEYCSFYSLCFYITFDGCLDCF